nr:MAG TPA: hypothetical protein [Caudoviricetes sp.]
MQRFFIRIFSYSSKFTYSFLCKIVVELPPFGGKLGIVAKRITKEMGKLKWILKGKL